MVDLKEADEVFHNTTCAFLCNIEEQIEKKYPTRQGNDLNRIEPFLSLGRAGPKQSLDGKEYTAPKAIQYDQTTNISTPGPEQPRWFLLLDIMFLTTS